ncbi:hypothetical protein R0J87_24125, partial [Halomonas sp. SIMBA_159]
SLNPLVKELTATIAGTIALTTPIRDKPAAINCPIAGFASIAALENFKKLFTVSKIVFPSGAIPTSRFIIVREI